MNACNIDTSADEINVIPAQRPESIKVTFI